MDLLFLDVFTILLIGVVSAFAICFIMASILFEDRKRDVWKEAKERLKNITISLAVVGIAVVIIRTVFLFRFLFGN